MGERRYMLVPVLSDAAKHRVITGLGHESAMLHERGERELGDEVWEFRKALKNSFRDPD